MAEAAAGSTRESAPMLGEAKEIAAAYVRLRAQARALTERAGWSVEDFDAELPELVDDDQRREGTTNEMRLALRGRVLLGQLAAWAAGYQETFEIEARLEADARAKAEQTRRGPAGFAG
jgi:hypothetical protein